MSTILPEKDLPAELTPEQSVEAAYAHELAEVASKLNRGLPSLIECDKDLAPFVFLNLRTRLREFNMRCRYLDGRPRGDRAGGLPRPAAADRHRPAAPRPPDHQPGRAHGRGSRGDRPPVREPD